MKENAKPTEKQLEFIRNMEEFIDEEFEGTTRKEASEFIDRNINKYRLYSMDSWALTHGYF